MPKATAAKTVPSDVIYLPLNTLSLSLLNSRQTVPQAEVEAMADSIIENGLLQNLVAHKTPDGRIEIVGGGVRFRALQLLRDAGFIADASKPIDPVPVKITLDAGQAVAWSGAENNARNDPAPADQVRSFAAMRTAGASVPQIARSFAVPEAVVKRYLALADLPGPAIDALRDGEITFEQAKALTLAETQTAALDMLAQIKGRDTNVHQIRHALTSGKIPADDARAVYVTLPAYIDAGGKVSQDLFSDQAYLHDGPLLDQLAQTLGTALAATLCDGEGWKWAEFRPHWQSYDGVKSATQLYPTPGDLPEGDSERMHRLDGIEYDVISAEQAAERAALRARLRGDFTDDQRSTSGCVVYLDRRGAQISRGWQRHADRPVQVETVTADDGTVTQRAMPSANPTQPQNLIDDLARIKLAALQTALLDDDNLLYDLLAWQITADLKPWAAPLAISTTPQAITPEKTDGTRIDVRLADRPANHADVTAADFMAFLELDRGARFRATLARLLKIHTGYLADHLAHILQPDVRDMWTPTAAGYLGRLPVHQLDALWNTLVADADDQADFATLKNRTAKAARLEALFADMSVRETLGLSRDANAAIDAWLPPELQWSTPADVIAQAAE